MKFNLDELEQLVAQATPGPWGAVVSDKYNFTVAILPPDFPQTPLVGRIRDEQDAAYIVGACNAVPELIKMYREAEDKANNAWRILLEAQARIVEVQKRVRELEIREADYIEERDALLCTKNTLERQTVELASRLSMAVMHTVSPETWLAITEQAAKETKC